MSIGKRLKEARKEARFTQRELGGERYSPSYICQLEKDKIRPSVKALEFLGTRLGKTVNYFFIESEPKSRPGQKKSGGHTLRLLLNLGESYLIAGENASAQKVLKEALAINIAPDKHLLKAARLRFSGRLNKSLNANEAAERDLLEALAIYKEQSAPEEMTMTCIDLVQLYLAQQELKPAKVLFQKVKRFTKAGQITDPILMVDVWRCSRALHQAAGEDDQAASDNKKVLELCDQILDDEKLAGYYLDLSVELKKTGKTSKAVRYSKKALELYESLQNKHCAADFLLYRENSSGETKKTGQHLRPLSD